MRSGSEMTRGFDYNVSTQPIVRMGEPQDVAQAVVFLASQMSQLRDRPDTQRGWRSAHGLTGWH